MTFLKAQPLHASPCLDSFDGDCLREGKRELRPTLTLEPCTYAGTPVVSHVMPSVGRSVTSAEHQVVSLLLLALRHISRP